jgi:hypothetical protein
MCPICIRAILFLLCIAGIAPNNGIKATWQNTESLGIMECRFMSLRCIIKVIFITNAVQCSLALWIALVCSWYNQNIKYILLLKRSNSPYCVRNQVRVNTPVHIFPVVYFNRKAGHLTPGSDTSLIKKSRNLESCHVRSHFKFPFSIEKRHKWDFYGGD